jgi:hypothetical protein
MVSQVPKNRRASYLFYFFYYSACFEISKHFGPPLCEACEHFVGDEQLARLYPRFSGHQSSGWLVGFCFRWWIKLTIFPAKKKKISSIHLQPLASNHLNSIPHSLSLWATYPYPPEPPTAPPLAAPASLTTPSVAAYRRSLRLLILGLFPRRRRIRGLSIAIFFLL